MSRANQNTQSPARALRPRPASIPAVKRALHPLDAPPCAAAWNRAEMLDLLGTAPRVQAAVLIGIRDLAQPTVIFTVRHADLRTHAGQVSFPGGRVDAHDADAIAAALRESNEEIGLDANAAQPLGFLDCMETVSGYRVTPVVARIGANAVLSPQSEEVTAVFETPLAFLLGPAHLRERKFLMRGKRRSVYEYIDTQPLIWGATAAMLVNLMRRMKLMP